MKSKYTTNFRRALQDVAEDTLIMNDELRRGKTTDTMVELCDVALIAVFDVIEQLEKETGE